jgi:hypothetical protein
MPNRNIPVTVHCQYPGCNNTFSSTNARISLYCNSHSELELSRLSDARSKEIKEKGIQFLDGSMWEESLGICYFCDNYEYCKSIVRSGALLPCQPQGQPVVWFNDRELPKKNDRVRI